MKAAPQSRSLSEFIAGLALSTFTLALHVGAFLFHTVILWGPPLVLGLVVWGWGS